MSKSTKSSGTPIPPTQPKLSGVWANPPKPTPQINSHTGKNPPVTNIQLSKTSTTPAPAPAKSTSTKAPTNPTQFTSLSSPIPSPQEQSKEIKDHVPPKPTEPPVKVTSWSSLFANVTPPPLALPHVTANEDKIGKVAKTQQDSKNNELSQTLNALLDDFNPSITTTVSDLIPRGLMNPRNKCFLNVIVQLIFGCKGFWKLMQLVKSVTLPPKYEFLIETVKLSKEFTESDSKNLIVNPKIIFPRDFYSILSGFRGEENITQYQEDAQEFLLYWLDRLHEELIEAMQLKSKPKSEMSSKEESKDEWIEVGKKNQASVFLSKGEEFVESPITDIFGGKLRSRLKAQTTKAASARIEPFFCLHLDIENDDIVKLEQAIHQHFNREKVEGYVIEDSKAQVDASKQTLVEKLPNVLFIHLKRFSYLKEAEKIAKFIAYPRDLQFKPQYMSAGNGGKYRLIGVVSHIGDQATNGHYVCDIWRANSSSWFNFDDDEVHRAKSEQVMNRQAYILAYEKIE